jgi:hypothetical protein
VVGPSWALPSTVTLAPGGVTRTVRSEGSSTSVMASFVVAPPARVTGPVHGSKPGRSAVTSYWPGNQALVHDGAALQTTPSVFASR